MAEQLHHMIPKLVRSAVVTPYRYGVTTGVVPRQRLPSLFATQEGALNLTAIRRLLSERFQIPVLGPALGSYLLPPVGAKTPKKAMAQPDITLPEAAGGAIPALTTTPALTLSKPSELHIRDSTKQGACVSGFIFVLRNAEIKTLVCLEACAPWYQTQLHSIREQRPMIPVEWT